MSDCIISYYVTIKHQSGEREVQIESPWRQENIKRLACQCYTSLAASVAKSERMSDLLIIQIARQVRQEIKDACSEQHDSILRNCHKAAKGFSWRTVWLGMLGMHKQKLIIIID